VVYDWKALAPTHSLGISDVSGGQLYARRSGEGSLEIAALLNVGLEQPIALFGPAGAGKSTELAALANLRTSQWICSLAQLDRVLAYSERTSVDDVLEAIARITITVAMERSKVRLSPELTALVGPRAPAPTARGFDLLLATVREVRDASDQREVGLLVDGLEKASSGLARQTLVHLERLRGEARVVVVVPTEIATGSSAAILQDFHVMSIGAVTVSRTVDELMKGLSDGDRFLFDVAQRRLGVPTGAMGMAAGDTTAVAIRRSIVLSGGLVRTFLQLLQKAALYAGMRGRLAPDADDVTRAAQDQTNFLLRLLMEGDIEALRRAHGTSGFEIEIDRRVRFLSSGLLLEHRADTGPRVEVAPLLASAVFTG
jgi:hypothetical protein